MPALSGRVALITGVSRRIGIGHTLARRLHADGARVIVSGWTPHDDEMPWGADPAPLPDDIVRIDTDLGEPDTPAALVAAAFATFGALDILVANHARSSHTGFAEVTAAELDRCWAVNARASVLLAQAFAQVHDDARPFGRVVLFTSGQHLGPMHREIAYAVSKGAIHQMTRSIADAVADAGITVNCINPGPVDTGWAPADSYDAVANAFPAKRWGTPDDVARLVAWLVSDEAAWITGQVINSDGGVRALG